MQKLKSAPRLKYKKIFSICPKSLPINAELYGLVLAKKRPKKNDTNEFGKPICNPWGQCFNSY
jgi:hypothetical protein